LREDPGSSFAARSLVSDLPQFLSCGRFRLRLDRPLIMGVVNVTPDSFSDGGRFLDPEAAIERAHRLREEGADLLDIGAESSRPGADAGVSADEELHRLLPVLRGLRDFPVPLSVDTTKPEVMRAAADAGAAMINDIQALRSPGALEAAAGGSAAICLMHMQGEPRTMQRAPQYGDVVAEVRAFLAGRIAAAEAQGIARARLAIDPGFGFGKTVEHNFELLRHLGTFAGLGVPVMAGWSRKSTLGAVTGRLVADRLAASLAAALLAVQHGARIVRVHDVAATKDALAVLAAERGGSGGQR
jgi:dihydropteroate synthase